MTLKSKRAHHSRGEELLNFIKEADSKSDRKSTSKALKAGAAGAIVGGVASQLGTEIGAGATRGIYRKAKEKSDPEALKRLIKQVDRRKFNIYSADPSIARPNVLLDKHYKIKREGGRVTSGSTDSIARFAPGSGKKSIIFTPGGRASSPTAFLHELGHGTGKANKSRAARYAVRQSKKLTMPIARYGIGGAVGGAAAYSAESKKEIERANKINNAAAAGQVAMASPLLAEEARANIRAVGLGKKFGVKANKAQLAAAFGTYAGTIGASALAPWALNRAILKRKRRKLKKK